MPVSILRNYFNYNSNYMNRLLTSLLIMMFALSSLPMVAQEKETLVLMDTNMGKIKVRLFNDTPLHRDNFVKNVNAHVYDSVLFHRIVRMFMVQGGDPESKSATAEDALGNEATKETIPAEIVYPKYFHKRGMLCAARTGDEENPEKASSATQFYIVTGKHFTEMELDKLEKNENKTFTPEQREGYMTEGGTPHLDGNYTIFGEVVSGMKVVDKMQFVPVNEVSRPLKDVRIKSMKVVEK